MKTIKTYQGKEKEARLNIPILFRRFDEYKKAVITSSAGKPGYGDERYVWTVMDGKRRKESILLCYEDTQENQDKITEIAQLRMQVRETHDSIFEIADALVPVNLNEKGDE